LKKIFDLTPYWYNIIITFENIGSKREIYYINSEYIHTHEYSKSILDVYYLTTFKIGSEDFKGTIDDITIYDRVLSQDEIDSIYNYNLTTHNKEIVKTEDLKIYPNPTTDYIKISDNTVKTKLYNMSGQLVLSGNYELDLRDIYNGMYILNIYNNRGELLKTEKVIKY
jgi:hypothetical protein